MHMRYFTFLCILAIALCPIASHAVALRFIASEARINDLYIQEGNKKTFISADANSLSRPLEYSGSSLQLFEDVRQADGTMKQVERLKLPLPKDVPQLIIALRRDDPKSPVVRGFVVDDSAEGRSAATATTLNLSNHPLAIRLGENQFRLEPEAHRVEPVDASRQRFVISMAAAKDKQWELVSSNPIGMRPGLRVFILIRDWRARPGSKRKLVEFIKLYDSPPKPEQ